MSDQLTEIAQTFLSLTPEGRAQFINTLAGSNLNCRIGWPYLRNITTKIWRETEMSDDVHPTISSARWLGRAR